MQVRAKCMQALAQQGLKPAMVDPPPWQSQQAPGAGTCSPRRALPSPLRVSPPTLQLRTCSWATYWCFPQPYAGSSSWTRSTCSRLQPPSCRLAFADRMLQAPSCGRFGPLFLRFRPSGRSHAVVWWRLRVRPIASACCTWLCCSPAFLLVTLLYPLLSAPCSLCRAQHCVSGPPITPMCLQSNHLA